MKAKTIGMYPLTKGAAAGNWSSRICWVTRFRQSHDRERATTAVDENKDDDKWIDDGREDRNGRDHVPRDGLRTRTRDCWVSYGAASSTMRSRIQFLFLVVLNKTLTKFSTYNKSNPRRPIGLHLYCFNSYYLWHWTVLPNTTLSIYWIFIWVFTSLDYRFEVFPSLNLGFQYPMTMFLYLYIIKGLQHLLESAEACWDIYQVT